MLRIAPETAMALEADLLRRWKDELAAGLAPAFPQEAARQGPAGLDACVRQMMDAARQLGATQHGDVRRFSFMFFVLAEVRRDEVAMQHFLALFAREEAFADKLSFAALAFPDIRMPDA